MLGLKCQRSNRETTGARNRIPPPGRSDSSEPGIRVQRRERSPEFIGIFLCLLFNSIFYRT